MLESMQKTGDPAAHRTGGGLTWALSGLVGGMGCCGQEEVGPDRGLRLMLHCTGEHPLRLLQ